MPSELVRRAEVKGYTAIALTDHADTSNIDFIVPRLVKVSRTLNAHWKIRSIPGVEITHAPIQEIARLVRAARKYGARIVLVHGETVSEPVIPGTNRYAIEAGCDILAHPGLISEEDARLAARKGVCLEITTRKSHRATNRHVFERARRVGAKLVLNNDAHSDMNLVSETQAKAILRLLAHNDAEYIKEILDNSANLARKALR